jgi:peptidoglycan hydrolase FlgJ
MNLTPIPSSQNAHTPMSADNPRLKSAAHEFEASLMQEFLKPLQHDPLFAPDKSDESDSDSDDQGSSGALMSFGSEAMARAISERGGFGIATKILDHFGTQAKPDASLNSGKLEGSSKTGKTGGN